jgi:hypothetical protein
MLSPPLGGCVKRSVTVALTLAAFFGGFTLAAFRRPYFGGLLWEYVTYGFY